MSIFGTLPNQGPVFVEQLDAPTSDWLSAAASNAWRSNPTSLLKENYRYRNAMPSDSIDEPDDFLDQETAFDLAKGANLNLSIPESGMSRRALNILMERKRDEIAIRSTLARSKTGIGGKAAELGVGLAVSMLDPLNVATAFIPIANSAKVSAALARANTAGRFAVRAQVGALEGAVGAAAVEPLVYGLSKDMQDDYTLQDSILNIAFGTVLGGGLHAGAGYIGERVAARWGQNSIPDILERSSPEIREAALRTSVAQMASGRTIEIDPVLRAANDAELDRLFAPPEVRKLVSGSDIGRPSAPVAREQTATEYLAGLGGLKDDPELRAILDNNPSVPGAGRLIRKTGGMGLDDALRALHEGGYLHDPGFEGRGELKRTVREVLDILDNESRGVKTYPGGNKPEAKGSEDGLSSVIADIVKAHKDELIDLSDTDQQTLYRAAQIVAEDGTNPFDALERAAIEMEDLPLGTDGAIRPPELQGWSVADVAKRAQDSFEGPSRLSDVLAATAADAKYSKAVSFDRKMNEQLAALRFNVGGAIARFGKQGQYGAAVLNTPQAISAPKIKRDLGVDIPGTLIEGPDSIKAYHGTPHDFDKFSMDKIGTGEGAQAYGHGLYFAESEGVARSYQKNLTEDERWLIDGKPAEDTPLNWAAVTVERWGGSVKDAIDDLKYKISNTDASYSKAVLDRDKKILEVLESGTPLPKVTSVLGGALYEVRIKASPDKFLDWDKPLSEQPKAVQQLIEDMRSLSAGMPKGDRTGKELIGDIAGYAWGAAGRPVSGGDKAFIAKASDELKAAGISGIRYLDGGSRKAGDGSRNYVVFDDNLIEIVAKNGERVSKPEPLVTQVSGEATGTMQDTMRAGVDIPKSADVQSDYVAPILYNEINDFIDEARLFAASIGDENLVARELAEFDDLIKTADGYGDTIRALASCQLRRGA